MSNILDCIKKMGKMLNKNDIKFLKDTYKKHLDAGLSQSEASKRAVEDFVLDANAKVVAYEKEIEAKGGNVGPSFDLKGAIKSAKRGLGFEETNVGGINVVKEGEFTADEQAMRERVFGAAKKRRSLSEFVSDTFTDAKTKFRQNLVDQYAAIKDILHDPIAYMQAHLVPSSDAMLMGAMKNGRPFLDSNGVASIDKSKKSMLDILDMLGDKADRWTNWFAANRAKKLMAEERELLFSEEDLKIALNMNSGDVELFNKAKEEFEALNDAVVQVGVQTGLINAEQADTWAIEGFYLPFYRVLDISEVSKGPRAIGNVGLARQQAFKKLKGSEKKLDNLMVNAVLNWEHLLSASLKNQAAVRAVGSAVELGIATPISKQAATKNKEALYVRKDGKEEWYEIHDPLVFEALNALNWEGFNSQGMKAGRAFKRALTYGVTLSPEFKVANLIRDSIQALATTDINVNLVTNIAQGWDATKPGSDTQIAMDVAGATFTQSGHTMHGNDRASIQKLITKGISPKTILSETVDFLNVFKHYQELGARAENITRAADYVQMIAAGKSTLEAAFWARDHLDFTRTGSATWVRRMSQLYPFINARMQGLDKLARSAPSTAKEWVDPREKTKFKAVVGVYALATIGMYLAIKDDEEYKQLEEWEKRTYHHFKVPTVDGLFRIPRPFEVGAIGFFAESVMQQMVDDEAHGELFAERMVDTLTQTFAFNPLPQILKPAAEILGNENYFTGRPIEPPFMHVSGLSPVRRKKVWTSETAIELSKGMDKISWGKVVLSPLQVEHVVQGYLGWMGATVLSATDMLLTRPLTDSPTQPAMKLSEYPLIKRFMTTTPIKNTKYTTNFYNNLEEINNAFTDIRDAKKRGEWDEVDRMVVKHGDKLRMRKFYMRQQKRLGKINKRMALIKRSNVSKEDKRREIDRLTLLKNSITESAIMKTKLPR